MSRAKRQKKELTQSFLYQSAHRVLNNNTSNYDYATHEADYDEAADENISTEAELFQIEQSFSDYPRMIEDFDIKALIENTESNWNLNLDINKDKINANADLNVIY
jgi:hypothetical protein